MRKKRKPGREPKRNLVAHALTDKLFGQRVVKSKKAYQRKPRMPSGASDRSGVAQAV